VLDIFLQECGHGEKEINKTSNWHESHYYFYLFTIGFIGRTFVLIDCNFNDFFGFKILTDFKNLKIMFFLKISKFNGLTFILLLTTFLKFNTSQVRPKTVPKLMRFHATIEPVNQCVKK